MAKRVLFVDNVTVVTADFLNDVEEMLSHTQTGFILERTSASGVRATVLPGEDPRGVVVLNGKHRFTTISPTATVSGASGWKDIYAVGSPDAGADPSNNSSKSWSLQVVDSGGSVSSTGGARKIGRCFWDGATITQLEYTWGMQPPSTIKNAVVFTNPAPASTPLRVDAGADINANIFSVGKNGTVFFAVDKNGQVTGGGVPAGLLSMYAGETAPEGWLLCHGQAVSRSIFATLFAIIGTKYGAGNGSSTFNVPDFRGTFGVGMDNMGGTAATRVAEATSVGTRGGAATHALTAGELAAHDHTLSTAAGHTHTIASSGAHTHSGNTGNPVQDHSHEIGPMVLNHYGPTGGSAVRVVGTTEGAGRATESTYTGGAAALHAHSYTTPAGQGSHTHTVDSGGSHSHTVGSAGGGSAHNNLPPYLTVSVIVKT